MSWRGTFTHSFVLWSLPIKPQSAKHWTTTGQSRSVNKSVWSHKPALTPPPRWLRDSKQTNTLPPADVSHFKLINKKKRGWNHWKRGRMWCHETEIYDGQLIVQRGRGFPDLTSMWRPADARHRLYIKLTAATLTFRLTQAIIECVYSRCLKVSGDMTPAFTRHNVDRQSHQRYQGTRNQIDFLVFDDPFRIVPDASSFQK